MDRNDFHRLFKCVGPAVLPVIHVQDSAQAIGNVRIALREGAQGVFLINHDFPYEEFLPIIRDVRAAFPMLWLGVNFLAVTGDEAFPVLAQLADAGCPVDAYWADDARIDERRGVDDQPEAAAITAARRASGWNGLYFGGTAFKKQRAVKPQAFAAAARIAAQHMDVVTTSGVATGESAAHGKAEAFRQGCDEAALALASGITPENVASYAAETDAILVATGINRPGDFYNIDPLRLRRLLSNVRRIGAGETAPGNDRAERWYLSRMAPNVKGETFAWLDPSAIYLNAQSFHALVDDLAVPFAADAIELVAGLDAMGFILGTAIATRLGTGVLTIRKAGKLPVVADAVDFTNYSGRTQQMEMRKPAFRPGTRVLLVDQWVETGGTMTGAIELIERQGGVVGGIAAVCIEENAATTALRAKYKCVSAVMSGSAIQEQCNRQTLDSFADFTPEMAFPDTAAEG